MKKIVSAALCLCMAAATLASCAQKSEPYFSPRITVSSSAAEDSAVWLTKRLGDSLTGRIVLAVGDSANSIDMTNCRSCTSMEYGSGGTGSLTCAAAMSTGVVPVNGRCPHSPSYATTPSE